MRARSAQKKSKTKTLQIAVLFTVVVVLIIGISLIIKVCLLFSRSTFDSTHQYIFQINHSQERSSVIIFDPDTQKIALLHLHGSDANAPLAQTLHIPADSKIDEIQDKSISHDGIHELLIDGHQLNIIDKLKLLLYSQTVASEDIHTIDVFLPLTSSTDGLLTPFLTDQSMYKEGVSIAIINGSGIAGLGNNTAAILEHIGANVISVTTADKESPTSSLVYTGEKKYTVSRIEKILSLHAQSISTQHIATITITLGADAKKKLKNI